MSSAIASAPYLALQQGGEDVQWPATCRKAHGSISQYCLVPNDTQVISSLFFPIVNSYVECFASDLQLVIVNGQ
jgi:hypothetical protein